ncbi:hypothetical protein B0I00_1273 [Novosphingobium kunmingense]|uniref:M23 family peptidase n=1 Tax=Novosphingobium kunmingense TaxID=1211806 RepID=A0A2N0HJC1_9SPHN|nr:hypothetical protein [Novosphingobium kunmingense]PKB19046.1 hypothetical protein B0I00_1273 [Novosphingobium kunmingense]
MNQLDMTLARLGNDQLPASLDGLDAAVLGGIGPRRERQIARRTLALAGAIGVLVGTAGAIAAPGPAMAEPIFGVPAAAPSSLLLD